VLARAAVALTPARVERRARIWRTLAVDTATLIMLRPYGQAPDRVRTVRLCRSAV